MAVSNIAWYIYFMLYEWKITYGKKFLHFKYQSLLSDSYISKMFDKHDVICCYNCTPVISPLCVQNGDNSIAECISLYISCIQKEKNECMNAMYT